MSTLNNYINISLKSYLGFPESYSIKQLFITGVDSYEIDIISDAKVSNLT